MKRDTLLICGSVIIVGLVAYTYFKNRLPSFHGEETFNPAENQAQTTLAEPEKPQTKAEAAHVLAKQKAHSLRMESGLQIIPSKVAGDKISFRMKAAPFAMGCKTGDFDLIKTLATSYSAPEFLLSVEPVGKKSGEASISRIALSHISTEKEFDIVLPRASEGARDFGIYLCRDKDKANACAGKPDFNYRSWSKALNPNADNNKNIYFQMISIKQDVVYLIPSGRWGRTSMDKLKSVMGAIMESLESLNVLKQKIELLTSTPARVVRGRVELPLPYLNPSCK